MDLDTMRIEALAAGRIRAEAHGELAALLQDAVHGGASVGFLAPLGGADAGSWWCSVAEEAERGVRRVWGAYAGEGGLLGVVTLVRAGYPNQRHRGDISKLLVHSAARGRGLGRRLLATAEAGALEAGLTLLTLDTETGSAAEGLYRTAGWTRAGTIPGYAAGPDGVPKPTTYYYKALG